MAAFATAAELLQRYDYRVIGQLISDTGTAENAASILANPITTQMLEDASGMIVLYAVKGGRYSEADLSALTGNGAAALQRLTCDLAIYNFVLRRGLPVDEYPQIERAFELLTLIGEGQVIFPIIENIEAGVAQSPDISIQTIVDNNHIGNNLAYFPTPRFTYGQIG